MLYKITAKDRLGILGFRAIWDPALDRWLILRSRGLPNSVVGLQMPGNILSILEATGSLGERGRGMERPERWSVFLIEGKFFAINKGSHHSFEELAEET